MTVGSSLMFESYITDVLRSRHLGIPCSGFISCDLEGHDQYWPISSKIIDKASKLIPIGFYNNIGKSYVSVSDIYRNCGCAEKTSPKADLISSDNQKRVSLKFHTKSQIISSSFNEILAISKVAKDRSHIAKTDYDAFLEIISSTMVSPVVPIGLSSKVDIYHLSTKKGSTKPGLKEACKDHLFRTKLNVEENAYLDIVNRGLEMMKDNYASKLLQQFMITHPLFFIEFVLEAFTGNHKFQDSNNSANTILSFTKQGYAKIDYLTYDSLELDKVKFRFRWKHGGKIRLAIDLINRKKTSLIMTKQND